MKRLATCVALFLLQLPSSAGELGFAEEFALSKDRAETLKKLIPGTEDYYYFHCLHFLNIGQYAKVEPLTRPWLERFGQTARLTEIQTRHALLTYDKNPEGSLGYLKNHLNLRFDHQREIIGGAPNLPIALDQRLIARATLKADSLARWSNLDNFEDVAFDWLAGEKLDWQRRRNLIQRLPRPDIADLPRLIVEDLNSLHSPGFGAFPVHGQLTQSQLQELARLKPDLLNQSFFVNTMIAKLHPGNDEDWRHEPKLAKAYLDRLLGFVRRLDAVHNSLKAHVLFHRLVLDQTQGNYDKDLFVEYLKLPRQQGYMSRGLLEAESSRRHPADLNANYTPTSLLPIVGNDEPLVRDYLKHFFLTADGPREYEAYINDVYLKHLYAETNIEQGKGDPENWASQLPPEIFRQLKERVDIDFAPTNKTSFTADEPVSLDLFVKNVPTLIVKVFEINTLNYYRTHQREVDTDINLDGLVANSEKTLTYADPPLRRIDRKFEFPQLTKPGVYVVDFIGGGKSSRALIRKGRFRPLVTTGTAGPQIVVVDDANRPVKDASVWLGGQDYNADPTGVIIVPFSTSPGRRPIVIHKGDFSCLEHLEHQAENYQLVAGIHVDRESLLTQRIAPVLIRPGVFLNGQPVSVKLLEEVRLRIIATDNDGIATSVEVPKFKLWEDRESIYEFRVPTRLASLQITLMAKVKNLSQGKPIDLASGEFFSANAIAKTDRIEDLHLAKFGPDNVIELLGRSGEPKPDRPVHLALKHREFREPVHVTLKTDALGRVYLGALADIATVSATGPEGTSHTWSLGAAKHTYRQLMHAKAGDRITLPYLGKAAEPDREELALFEIRGSTVRDDKFEALAINEGMIEIRGLAAGDYDLWLKRTGERIRIRVVDGGVYAGHVLGNLRHMQLAGLKPVQINGVVADDNMVVISLKDASRFTRVHVFATRYQPAFSAHADLSRVRDAELQGMLPAHAESAYLSGRNIGDEYRYVLDRKLQKKYPGNLLDRPALLLNPWIVRSTETGEQMAKAGQDFQPKGEPAPSAAVPAMPESPEGHGGRAIPDSGFADLDFLADASGVAFNLVPDKDGIVKVSRKILGTHSMIHVVAIDPLNTTSRSISLPEQAAKFVDLRLRNGLDPKAHFSQQKQVTVLPPGKPFVLADAAASRFEVYDSLAKVYSLYSTLSKDPKLAEFSFILIWPTLKNEEKRTLYSKYACHELNFFLAKKDRTFFDGVVRPYLANKKDKTFLDHWLLEDNLGEFLKPWQFERLNTVERILLAQRIAGEPAKTARHLNDLLRLTPPNGDRLAMLFDTAVKGSALAADDALGLERQKQEIRSIFAAGGMRVIRSTTAAPRSPAADSNLAGGMGGGSIAKDRPVAEKRLRELAKKMDQAQSKVREAKGAAKDGKEQFTLEALNATDDLPAKYFEDARFKSKLPAQLYRKLDPTQELAENNYYNLPIQQQLAALVPTSEFWLDYARQSGNAPFLSRNLAEASRNFTEMMFALAVLDLPFTAAKLEAKFDGGKMTLVPNSTMVAFHEEVRAEGVPAGNVQILVSQNFYRANDRYREENGERYDKFVTNEFIVHTVYGCQLVITNPTPSRQKLSVLMQTPVGSIPVANGQPTKTVQLDLEPYRTQTIDYYFYFPQPGRFAHFPVHVAKNESLVAAATPFSFNVVAKPSKLDTESWDYVSQHGTAEQVLAYLDRENVNALNLEKIAFRMKDRDFFNSCTALLQSRHLYQHTLWSYSLAHNAVPPAREFLLHAEQIVAECGGPIESPLLTVDPVARHQYEHFEYKPLVNARAHSLGQQRQIVNGRFFEQYHRLMKMLGYRKQLSDDDLLAVTYYMLLQDRIEEALATFAMVNPEKLATRLQYDYCAAYLDMYRDEPRSARAIAAKYANYPVDRWRNMFVSIANQVDEIEGKAMKIADADDRNQKQAQLAASAPNFEFTMDAKTMNLAWQNLDSMRVNYYLMDVELLFSQNPFVQQSGGQFSSIRPNFTQEVKLPKDQTRQNFTLPANLARRNVLVEITAAGKTRSIPYYANAMNLQMTENYGQLRVTDAASGKPLAKVYVKTYVRQANGQVKFHKDGYTDLRGRFDYSSVNTPERSAISRFAILVLSDEHGALIREAAPPQQ